VAVAQPLSELLKPPAGGPLQVIPTVALDLRRRPRALKLFLVFKQWHIVFFLKKEKQKR
jgi:hypothetical protein